MKLPKLEKTDQYQGLYVFDFGEHTAVGFTAQEVAELLESERFQHGKVYKIHQAYPDGTLDDAVYHTLGKAFEYLRLRQKYVEDTQVQVDTAVLFTDGICSALRGADAICCDLNLQYDLIDEEGLAQLSRYRLLIVAEIGVISKSSLSYIRNFVQQGGLVLITGSSAVDNDFGDIAGVSVARQNEFSIGYLPSKSLSEPEIPLLLPTHPYRIHARTAKTFIPLQMPSCEPTKENFVSHLYSNPGNISDLPAVTINTLGKGRVIYIGFDLFSSYWENSYWRLKNLANKCLQEMDLCPLVKISSDGIVRSFLRRKNQTMYLHLVSYSSQPVTSGDCPPIEQTPNAYNNSIYIEVDSKPKGVYLEPEGKSIDFDYCADKRKSISVEIDKIIFYQVLRIEL